MAAAANHSPRKPVTGDASAAINSAQSRRGTAARGGASPWTQVVRGLDSETIASSSTPPPSSPPAPLAPALFGSSPADFSDDSVAEIQPDSGADNCSAASNAAKKPAWNKPSNGGIEIGPVMGAVSWPALSESTRASPKAPSSESPKPLPDGSVSLPQGAGIASPSSRNQVMVNDINPSLTPNNVIPTRQKSMKRGGGGSGSISGNNTAYGGFSQPPPPPPPVAAADMPPIISGKSGPAVVDLSPRDHTHKESGQRGVVGSQSRSSNDYHQQRESFRKGNGGPHSRSDGPHHHNFGGRGNQDRGNHEWNSHRNFNGRDSHMQPQRGAPRGYRPPAHASAPFVHPPPVAIRPYPMVYPGNVPPTMILYAAQPPEPLRGVPIIAPISPHGMFYTGPDPQLIARIVHQIDYYFSNENLVKDIYLRTNMDEQGWVPIRLIASFKKMSGLTDNIQLILDASRSSSVVEVQGDKIRRREDWARWVMPPVQSPNVSSPHSQGSPSYKTLVANIQSLSLEEKPTSQGQAEACFSRSSSSGDFSQPQATALANVQACSDQTVSTRGPSE